MANIILKENKVGGLILPDLKTFCKTTLIKMQCDPGKRIDRQVHGTEYRATEMTPHKHSHGGFPGGARGKESTCQCRRHGFDPWVGKIHWRRKWQPTSVLLPGKLCGYRSLVGDSPQDYKESDVTKVTQQPANTVKLTKEQRQFDGAKSFQQTVLEQVIIHLQKS